MLRKRMALAAALVLVGAGRLPAQDAAPGLEPFLSYSFVNDLTASQTGDRFAWVEIRRGVRNLWMAEAPAFTPRRVTNGTTDDGQELSAIAWSPDGRVLAWERGAVEHNGWADGMPAANPTSATVQPQMEIWVSVAGGAPVKIGEGEDPAVSATGRVAYISSNQVWTAPTDGAGKPAKLFYDRGKIDSLAWSPDGNRLAFVSRRGDHSFIGIYSGAERPITWLAPSTGIDDGPAWSPDGRRIAFAHRFGLPPVTGSPFEERPSPFEIWVGSAADGTASAVWKSPQTLEGSYPAVPDGISLMWGAGDRLVFRAEMDGWPHLYSLPARGGGPLLLTPGKFMVEHTAMSTDRRHLIYDANAGGTDGDIDRRHLFRVSVDRAGPVPLTSGTGLEWTAAPLANDGYAYIGASTAVPPHMMLADASGRGSRRIDRAGADYPADRLVTPRPVTFTAVDGITVHGQLFLPKGAGKHPALIFVHGGPTRQMLLGWSYIDYYTHAYAMNQYLASRGYVVLSVNYRLGIGYGRAFQHAAKAGPAGNAEYQDVLAGARYLQSLPQVDGARLGIWGGSYGGLLTAQALARDSGLFKAGVDFHGVYDWTIMPGRSVPTRFEQGGYAEATRVAWESSPDFAVAKWRSPVLLIQGDDDRNVRFDQSVDIARRLRAQGTPFEELILPNEIHGFLRYYSWLRADTASVRFLDKHLKP